MLQSPSGLTLELILNPGEYFSQLLGLRNDHGRSLGCFLVRYVFVIVKCGAERFEYV